MLTCFSKSSSRFADSSTVMSSVSCPSNSEIGHWVPIMTSFEHDRCRGSSLLLTSLDNVSSPHVSALSVWSTPFLLPHFRNFASRFPHDAIFSLIDSIPHSVTDSCKSYFSIVIRRSKKVRNSSLVRPSRQAVLWSSNFFGFRNGHIFITYFHYDTKKQTTSFRPRDDDRADLPRLRNSSSQLIPSMT